MHTEITTWQNNYLLYTAGWDIFWWQKNFRASSFWTKTFSLKRESTCSQWNISTLNFLHIQIQHKVPPPSNLHPQRDNYSAHFPIDVTQEPNKLQKLTAFPAMKFGRLHKCLRPWPSEHIICTWKETKFCISVYSDYQVEIFFLTLGRQTHRHTTHLEVHKLIIVGW